MKGETYKNQFIFTLVDDKKGGGKIVECSFCETQFETPNICEIATCPNCNTHLIYPEYAEW